MRLSLYCLVIVLLQLTDKWQHLRQQGKPVFAQAIGEGFLALHGGQADAWILGAHVLHDGRVELLMMLAGVCGSTEGYDARNDAFVLREAAGFAELG